MDAFTEGTAVPEAIVLEPENTPELEYVFVDGIGGIGFSQQGRSHRVRGNVPCQDSCGIRFIKGKPIILAAVADGVGSCECSHYGSRTAVDTVLDYVKEKLEPMVQSEDFVFTDNERMARLMHDAFTEAVQAVEKQADTMDKLVYSFQSTLTLGIYDGKSLYFAHAGDDGIVALCADGSYRMVTARHKGNCANSVRTLQAQAWDLGLVDGEVVAFAMMTDGVLDAVVDGETMENRVYYPFFAPLFAGDVASEEDAEKKGRQVYAQLESPGYRAKVSDDLTLMVVTNGEGIANAVPPVFDLAKWEEASLAQAKRIRESLYPPEETLPVTTVTPPKPTTPPAPPPGEAIRIPKYTLYEMNTAVEMEELCRFLRRKGISEDKIIRVKKSCLAFMNASKIGLQRIVNIMGHFSADVTSVLGEFIEQNKAKRE